MNFWKLAKPYWIIGRIAVLVLGSLAYLQFVEGFKRFSKALKTNSKSAVWEKQDIVDLP